MSALPWQSPPIDATLYLIEKDGVTADEAKKWSRVQFDGDSRAVARRKWVRSGLNWLRTLPWCWPDTTGLRKNARYRTVTTGKKPCYGVQRIAFLPAIPHQCFVRLGEVSSRFVLHKQHLLLYSESLGVALTV